MSAACWTRARSFQEPSWATSCGHPPYADGATIKFPMSAQRLLFNNTPTKRGPLARPMQIFGREYFKCFINSAGLGGITQFKNGEFCNFLGGINGVTVYLSSGQVMIR